MAKLRQLDVFPSNRRIILPLRRPTLPEPVEEHGEEKDDTPRDILVEGRYIEQVHGVLDGAHDEDADYGADHGSDPAGERDAAQHAGRDDIKREPHRGVRLAAGHARGEYDSRKPGHEALEGEDEYLDAVHPDARETGGFPVPADGSVLRPKWSG